MECAPLEATVDHDPESGTGSAARRLQARPPCRSRNNVDSPDPEYSAASRFPDAPRTLERSRRPRRSQFSNAYSLASQMASLETIWRTPGHRYLPVRTCADYSIATTSLSEVEQLFLWRAEVTRVN